MAGKVATKLTTETKVQTNAQEDLPEKNPATGQIEGTEGGDGGGWRYPALTEVVTKFARDMFGDVALDFLGKLPHFFGTSTADTSRGQRTLEKK